MRIIILGLVASLALLSCRGQKSRDLEDYGDITNSPGGIALTSPDEHVGGWGRSDCLLCHNASLNIHRRPGSPVDADALNELVKKNGGSQYCLNCHGPNGIN
jgi:hypothetical protein